MAKYVKLDIEVESGNDAIVDCPAVRMAEILEDMAHRLRSGRGGGKITDVNGNAIGRMDFLVE